MRTYVADAGFSPTRTAARPGMIPALPRRAISTPSSARISRPIATPSMSLALSGKVHRPGLADDHHTNLGRGMKAPFDLARDLLRERIGPRIVHHVRRDHDANLPPRLNGVDLLDAVELARDLLDRGQPLDVRLERLAAGAGP